MADVVDVLKATLDAVLLLEEISLSLERSSISSVDELPASELEEPLLSHENFKKKNYNFFLRTRIFFYSYSYHKEVNNISVDQDLFVEILI